MKFFNAITSASLIGFALLSTTACGEATTNISHSPGIAIGAEMPQLNNPHKKLSSGQATFQHVSDEKAETFEYTYITKSPYEILVTYSDGMKVGYHPNYRDESKGDLWIVVGDEWTEAFIELNGDEAIIKTENNTTRLGGFRKPWEEAQTKHKQQRARNEAQEADRKAKFEELNGESFDSMVSRLSKKACVVLESKKHINSNSVTESMNEVMRNGFEMGSIAKNRWQNMNSQLRREHVANAMMWDCNNAISLATQNDINSSLNMLQWQLNSY